VLSISAGGVDTTVSAMSTFILAMTCCPDIQSKAHEELDRVLVPGHLPLFEDELSLPYITAVMKEVIRCVVLRRRRGIFSYHFSQRWQSVAPLAIPHYVTEDDKYNGYLIPKGSIVAGNTWYSGAPNAVNHYLTHG